MLSLLLLLLLLTARPDSQPSITHTCKLITICTGQSYNYNDLNWLCLLSGYADGLVPIFTVFFARPPFDYIFQIAHAEMYPFVAQSFHRVFHHFDWSFFGFLVYGPMVSRFLRERFSGVRGTCPNIYVTHARAMVEQREKG